MSYSNRDSGLPGGGGPGSGLAGFIEVLQLLSNIQQSISEVANVLGNSYIALAANNVFTGNNTFQGSSTFTGTSQFNGESTFALPIQLPKYTVSGLPAVTITDEGRIAFATNCRNTGQGGGAGSGALVAVDNTGAWAAVWSGVAPTS